MNALKILAVEDIVFAVVDGLKGFPDAITAVLDRERLAVVIWPAASGGKVATAPWRRRRHGRPGHVSVQLGWGGPAAGLPGARFANAAASALARAVS
jgi:hypothetical protein